MVILGNEPDCVIRWSVNHPIHQSGRLYVNWEQVVVQIREPNGKDYVAKPGWECSWQHTCFRIHWSWIRIRAPLIFMSSSISLQQAEITDVVLSGRFSSLHAVVYSASYPPGKANWASAYTGSATEFTHHSGKSFGYIQVVAFLSAI